MGSIGSCEWHYLWDVIQCSSSLRRLVLDKWMDGWMYSMAMDRPVCAVYSVSICCIFSLLVSKSQRMIKVFDRERFSSAVVRVS